MKQRAHDWLQRSWYGESPNLPLLPLSLLYRGVAGARSALYRRGLLATRRCAVPVIVVGNITVGGTGKTPVVIWLVDALRGRGWSPGVVSRGYGGRAAGSMRVEPGSDPSVAGDEPVLIAARTGCPVFVDRDRGRGAAELAAAGVDVVVADDGLQHHALARDFEICVVDGSRGLGNGQVLPAGPLREPAARLETVDQVLVNGKSAGSASRAALPSDAIAFDLAAADLRALDGADARPLAAFAGRRVHAVAAIGNPRRFFDLLRRAGLDVIEHPFPDHAVLTKAELDFDDGLPVMMTEKDAVKVAAPAAHLFALPVRVDMDPTQADALLAAIERRIGTPAGAG